MNPTKAMNTSKVIALATDGSSSTDGAVQEAIFLAQSCRARIVVLHVIPIDSGSATAIHASTSSSLLESKKYLKRLKTLTDDNEIPCEIIIEESYQPDKAIVELSYKHQADILIMGRNSRQGLQKLLAGSMTSKVIGRGFPKVLVVPKDFTIGGDKVLLAVDGSEASEAAADEIIDMGIHCTNLKEVYALSVTRSENGLAEARALAEAACNRGKEKAPRVIFHPMSLAGRPAADLISQTAAEKQVDMILIGGHGKGLTKLLMGHVTEKVIGKAHCAVLVIEKKKEDGYIPEDNE
ncbi:MAG: universal stress protein [Candidatus Electrothrix aestuarii]|uniref:Universal stress protein n=1 Tax=Candidatus Electrothrix aestuarii TaxID=3062594 RepID=A0AAU8LS32_9BACT|nr:universal stress protein [Candidatus Electrothrix aestuarii]